MADATTFLGLVKPLNGEFEDSWDGPANENFQKIDDWASGVNTELVDARFGKTSLKEFLEVAHEVDGSLKPTDEVFNARNSLLYGDEDASAQDLLLKDRLDLGDREVLTAREGQPSLLAGLARREQLQGKVLDGAKTGNGFAAWLGFSSADAQIDGSSTPLYIMIDGQVTRTRTLKQVTVSGVAGTKAIVANFSSDGVVVVDGDSGTPPPATPTGTTGSDGTKDRLFVDATKDFTAEDVEIGDVLEILGSNANAGEYIIKEVAPGGDNTALLINGVFPGGALSSLNYVVKDIAACNFTFEDTFTPGTGKLQIGEADFDGAAITAVRALHFNDTYVSDWRAIDVSGSPDFTEVFNHNLLSLDLDIAVQVSQANDGTAPVEYLAVGRFNNSYVFANTLAFTPGVFNPGTTDASYTPGSLTGDVTLSGTAQMRNAVKASFTQTVLTLKNAVSSSFYTDIDDTVRQSGFMRVIVRKRG